jgi:hypothetical protein
MNTLKPRVLSVYFGLVAVIISAISFSLSWNLWDFFDGPLPGYQVVLFPGNLTLIYFWHPIFTEEVNLWPKLAMLLFGQFTIVSSFVYIIITLVNKAMSLRSF